MTGQREREQASNPRVHARENPVHRAIRVCLLLAILGVVPAFGALNRNEIHGLYEEARDRFRQANVLVGSDPEKAADLYRKAALRLERIVEEGGIHNGRLYYNIGNAYFRMKDLGRAILCYRRAEQYTPNDPNLQQNLQYARSRCLDQIEEKQKTRVLKTLFFWHYDSSTATRSALFAFFFLLLWSAAAVRLFWHKPWLGWTCALAAAIALLLLASLLVEAAALRANRPGVVLSSEVIARKGDSETYERSFTDPLHAGTEFLLVEDREQWYHIELADGRQCWIPAQTAGLVR